MTQCWDSASKSCTSKGEGPMATCRSIGNLLKMFGVCVQSVYLMIHHCLVFVGNVEGDASSRMEVSRAAGYFPEVLRTSPALVRSYEFLVN